MPLSRLPSPAGLLRRRAPEMLGLALGLYLFVGLPLREAQQLFAERDALAAGPAAAAPAPQHPARPARPGPRDFDAALAALYGADNPRPCFLASLAIAPLVRQQQEGIPYEAQQGRLAALAAAPGADAAAVDALARAIDLVYAAAGRAELDPAGFAQAFSDGCDAVFGAGAPATAA